MEFGKIKVSRVRDVRCIVVLLGLLNVTLISAALAAAALSKRAQCPKRIAAAAGLVVAGATARTLWMWVIGFVQVSTASTMLAEEREPALPQVTVLAGSVASRNKRRAWYRCWLWWTRVGYLVTALQVIAAAYMTYVLVHTGSLRSNSHDSVCSGGSEQASSYLHSLFVIVPVAAWVLAITHCCAGSDILTWRSLYERRTGAWRAHYHEMFDYGIREVLCCLGRSQYMDVMEKEEVDSVAALLGELVAYRAEGASHLEFLAGVALLREQTPKSPVCDELQEAPANLLIEATRLHPYAVAAYTGPLLDVGRHRTTFLCAWLHRQGLFTPWNRKRRPYLDGDNWWRGHASAFIRHVKIPESALRKGRVCQTNREAVYFVVVLHEVRSVVVAVRGTETPEDLITDGLGKECPLADSDLQGLLKSHQIPESLRHDVASSRPHFGHIGVVAAARELAMQLDGHLEDGDRNITCTDGSRNVLPIADDKAVQSHQKGLLSSLLDPGGECAGYALRFVGHSLGGAIAALTALRLYNRFPSLHVYAYGVLPCLDAVAAKACSGFVTSIVYNDEFSSRLSVAAIMKLREKALVKLKAVNADSAVILKLWRCWGAQKALETDQSSSVVQDATSISMDMNAQQFRRRFGYGTKGGDSRGSEEGQSLLLTETAGRQNNGTGLHRSEVVAQGIAGTSMGPAVEQLRPVEMFVPGLVVHVTCDDDASVFWSPWKRSRRRSKHQHRALLRDRTHFRDIIVSPSMFLDHLPWRCQHALNDIVDQLVSRSGDESAKQLQNSITNYAEIV